MAAYTEPDILQDHSRLNEIYKLRCIAWEQSPYPNSINFEKFPNGYSDTLDDRSIHFVSFGSSNEIIAASRLTVLHDFEELPYPKIFTNVKHWPYQRPFLFYSRLVIHPNYRKQGLKEKMDSIRVKYQYDNEINFSVATSTQERAVELSRYGFNSIATVSKKMDSLFPFEHRELLLLLPHIKL